ncbi:hypothetical protein ACZ87_02451, partial [Candidatus Erwinia dacicola]
MRHALALGLTIDVQRLRQAQRGALLQRSGDGKLMPLF